MSTAECESLYVDIEEKVGRLLGEAGVVSDSSAVHEQAKDYLKVLHSVVAGEWCSAGEQTAEDTGVLQRHADTLVRLLVQCVARSFDRPALMLNKVPGTFLGVDVSLLAISLSTLFAMARRADLARSLSADCLFEVFHQCLLRLCDPKVLHPLTSDPDSLATAQQLVNALNMILVRMAAEAETSEVLRVLLRVMFLCIPGAPNSVDAARYALPSACTKPASRLIIKVLTDETERDAPHAGPDYDVSKLLQGIHVFFAQHPANTTDDTPFRTVKTVLNELIKARGGRDVLSVLQGCQEITPNSFIYLLTSRLGNVAIPQEVDAALHARIVSIIDHITSARDKIATIQELHAVLKANPSLDINAYLHRISAAFRRFVLDTLAKFDSADQGLGSSAAGDENQGHIENLTEQQQAANTSEPPDSTSKPARRQQSLGANRSSPAAEQQPSNSSGNSSGPASEAMRILEGLKNRPSHYKQLHSTVGSSSGDEVTALSGGSGNASFSTDSPK